MAKGQLRHIAVSVPDKEKTAKFYEETFGFKRVSPERNAARQCRAQVPRSKRHRLRYLNTWMGGCEAVMFDSSGKPTGDMRTS